ncbi:MAG TPA: prenyltransferase [Thermoanaerobaculia bacterium]|nr:prenyltransferase [Thermoanaerobaculia bacterium]
MRTASIVHWPHAIGIRQRNLIEGVWRLVDPKIALASVIPFLAGLALAIDQGGSIRWGIAFAAFAAIFLVEVGKNAVNDLCDFTSDVAVRPHERSPFSGGKRVLVGMLLTERDLVVIAWIAFIAAGAIGSEVARRSNPMLLLLGAAAAAISILYAAPPVKLASRGLGELAVGCVYGPGIVLGTLVLFDASVIAEAVFVSIALGMLIANVLLINEIPDERADAQAGKRTLIVRLGRDRGETLIGLVFANAFAIPLVVAAYGLIPFRVAAMLAGAPAAALAMVMLTRTRTGPPVAAQALTLLTYVLTGTAFAAVILLSR